MQRFVCGCEFGLRRGEARQITSRLFDEMIGASICDIEFAGVKHECHLTTRFVFDLRDIPVSFC